MTLTPKHINAFASSTFDPYITMCHLVWISDYPGSDYRKRSVWVCYREICFFCEDNVWDDAVSEWRSLGAKMTWL